MRVAAIILAAGTSTRMGSNKLLLPIRGTPMLTHVIDAALYSQACRVYVVVGHESSATLRLCSEYTTHVVHNEDYASGMASSIRAGIAALPADVPAALIMLGDMPFIGSEHVDRMLDASRAYPDSICAPRYRGQLGHPVLWPRCFFAELQRLEGDSDGRALLARLAANVRAVDFDGPAVLLDCDTPGALPDATPAAPQAEPRPQSKRY